VHITATTSYAACTTYDNTATATADNAPSVQAEDVITCNAPSLSITKKADASTVNAGDSIGFLVTVSNGGPGVAKNVQISDPLPAGVTWSIDKIDGAAPGATPPCSITAGTLNCSFGDMASGASHSVHITATTSYAACTTYDNTATATADNAPSVQAEDVITCNAPSLSITKTATPLGPVNGGYQIGFSITVSNGGPGVAKNVTMSDPLPMGSGISWSIDPAYSGPGTCSITTDSGTGAQTLNCSFGNMASGASITVGVTSPTTLQSCGTYPNTATAIADNNPQVQASASVDVVNCGPAPLTPGYWKNHQAQTTALLPQTLGNYTVATFAQAQAVFNAMNCSSGSRPPRPSGTTSGGGAVNCLAGHLLATKLNLANGTNTCILPVVGKADAFLEAQKVTYAGITATGVVYVGPSGTYPLNANQRALAIALKTALDTYNNGGGC
jgi:uncharacterized repeat protein (TIGR01451 family)